MIQKLVPEVQRGHNKNLKYVTSALETGEQEETRKISKQTAITDWENEIHAV